MRVTNKSWKRILGRVILIVSSLKYDEIFYQKDLLSQTEINNFSYNFIHTQNGTIQNIKIFSTLDNYNN